jgi:hypothetical protein
MRLKGNDSAEDGDRRRRWNRIAAVDIGLQPLTPKGEQILDELESDYGVRAHEKPPGGERLYVISSADVASHYERHLAGYDADWPSHVTLTVH